MTIASRTASAVALTALLAFAGIAGADTPHVVVRLYDASIAPPAVRAIAIRTAAAIVAEAGLDVEWRDCTDGASGSRCHGSRDSKNLIVRIMPTAPSGLPFGGSAIAARRNVDESSLRLGLAVVDPGTRIGSMLTLYQDHVMTVARRAGVEPGELLGRALAHELGHLLLGVSGHSPSGLMRAVWTDAELRQNRPDDFVFAAPDRQRLQQGFLPADDEDEIALEIATP